MPQSSSNFFPPASTKYLDPVTVPAAPRKVSFGMRQTLYRMRGAEYPQRFDNHPPKNLYGRGLPRPADPITSVVPRSAPLFRSASLRLHQFLTKYNARSNST